MEQATASSENHHRPSTWIMIATGMLVVVVSLICARLAYGLILPFMRQGLGLDYQQAGNLGTAAALGYLGLIMASGIAAARWGAQRTIVAGILLITTGFSGLSLTSSYSMALFWMLVLGCGTALSYTPTLSLLVGWYPKQRAGVIGAVNGGGGVGMLLAGYLVPYLNQTFGEIGWRVTWGLFAAAGVTAVIAVLVCLPNPPALQADPAKKTKDKSPSVYRNGQVIRIGFLYAIVGSIWVVQAIFMYSFALHAGLSAIVAGQLAAMMGILTIFSSPVCGWLADRFGRLRMIQILVFAYLIGTALPVVWPSLPGFAIHYVIIGSVVSGLFSVIMAVTTEVVPARDAPVAVSYVTLFYAVAQVICPAIAGLMIERAGGFQAVFAASAALIMVALVLAWRMQRDNIKNSALGYQA